MEKQIRWRMTGPELQQLIRPIFEDIKVEPGMPAYVGRDQLEITLISEGGYQTNLANVYMVQVEYKREGF